MPAASLRIGVGDCQTGRPWRSGHGGGRSQADEPGHARKDARLPRRATPNRKASAEVTSALRRLDPDDPVRYDFALCRPGVPGTCPRRRELRNCETCPLFDVFRL